MDWNAEAKRVAEYIRREMPDARRGAVTFGPADCVVLFGNEGDSKAVDRSDRLLQHLRTNIPKNYTEAGYSASELEDGSTWTIILRAHMGAAIVQTMQHWVWDSYGELFPGNEKQVTVEREVRHPHIRPLPQNVS